MKKLYLVLILLILALILINYYNETGFDFNDNKVQINESEFNIPANFVVTGQSQNVVELYDKDKNITLTIIHLKNTTTIENYFQKAANETPTVNNETISMSNIDTYITYRHTDFTNSTQVFFEKDGHNYRIWGMNYHNDDMDYFSQAYNEIISSLRPVDQGYIA
ncbi:MAG: hypothetical protein MR504_00680 [Methanobrevibacter woesei]|uniref:hypothetical protein n=1 Tax=Methanobrevibacter woesei TaxID=190976 RepID=UPI0023F2BE26|nr:hypothetical protein [Methanobrevibacter woesei]MCI7290694.1 hypothetical protein [Methanobrevibacter woesei]